MAIEASSGVTNGEVSVSASEAFSSLSDIKSSLKVYTYAELKAATNDFSPDRHIGGSVYRAVFNSAVVVAEVVDRDVLTEVKITRKINHFNLVRLVGLCHHRNRWYLVSEYAEHDTLHKRRHCCALSACRSPLTSPRVSGTCTGTRGRRTCTWMLL